MIRSMTGFASARGSFAPYSWTWELRSVNAKGRDLRLRIPEWLEGLEVAARAEVAKLVDRGNVTLSLRLTRSEETGGLMLNTAALATVLAALAEAEAQAMERGLTLAPSKASDLIALRGVLEPGAAEDDVSALVEELRKHIGPLLKDFVAMRTDEGRTLAAVMSTQIDLIDTLTAQAAELAEARKSLVAEALQANLARVLGNSDGADPDRVAQELAMLAVKADVTEELDRLRAHVGAARDLLLAGGPVGRKLDFLMQEFNREANTLCSKAQSTELTTVGLELKAVIDQMREQVQNVE